MADGGRLGGDGVEDDRGRRGLGHAISYGAVTVTPPPLEVTVNEASPWRV